MGIPVLIIGESGSGKSASLRNFQKEEVFVANVAGKPFPFRGQLTTFCSDRYADWKDETGKIRTGLDSAIRKAEEKGFQTIVIDDCQYLMANEFMRRSGETGYQKFTDIGRNFWALVKMVSDDLSPNVIVYFLGHVARDENGNEHLKTIGKLLDEKITVEGLFSIVLKTSVQDGKYQFRTQTNGADTVKSPIGMFETVEIDNDLKLVDEAVRRYWEI